MGTFTIPSIGSVRNVPTGTIAGKFTAGTGSLEAGSPAQVRALADVYSTTQVDDAISLSVVGLLDDRGSYNASVNTFPAAGGSGAAGAILKGDLWIVSVAGTLGGHPVTAGDIVRALVDTPGQIDANWAITENNLGYVPQVADAKLTNFAALANSAGVLTNSGVGGLSWTTAGMEINGPIAGATQGSVLFVTIDNRLGQSNANLFWDELDRKLGIGTNVPGAALHVVAPTAATIGAIVKGAVSQTASLQEWQDSAGAVIASISNSGAFAIDRAFAGVDPKIKLVNQEQGQYGSAIEGYKVDAVGAVQPAGRIIFERWPNSANFGQMRFQVGSFGGWGQAATLDANGAFTAPTVSGSPTISAKDSGGGDIVGLHSATGVTTPSAGILSHGIWAIDSFTAVFRGAGKDAMVISWQDRVGIGYAPAVTPTLNAKFNVKTHDVTVPTVVLDAIASQTANLLEWRSSAGAVLSLVDKGGNFGIGTNAPNANAILDVASTTKAFMPPRMTTTQRNAIPAPTAGMVIYNTTTNKLNVYTTAWEAVTSA